MASRFTKHDGFQDHHLAPEAVMNSHLLFTSDIGHLWERNNLSYNIIPLPTDGTVSNEIGVAQHFNTSHPGYSAWYREQLTIIRAQGGSAETKMAKVIGLNNVVKKALTDPAIGVSLQTAAEIDAFGNTLNSQAAWDNALSFFDRELPDGTVVQGYSQSVEFQFGLKGAALPIRQSSGDPITDNPFDTTNGNSALERSSDHDLNSSKLSQLLVSLPAIDPNDKVSASAITQTIAGVSSGEVQVNNASAFLSGNSQSLKIGNFTAINLELSSGASGVLDGLGKGSIYVDAASLMLVGYALEQSGVLEEASLSSVIELLSNSNLSDSLGDFADSLLLDVGKDLAFAAVATFLGVGIIWKGYEIYQSLDGLQAALDFAAEYGSNSTIDRIDGMIDWVVDKFGDFSVTSAISGFFGGEDPERLSRSQEQEFYESLPQSTSRDIKQNLREYAPALPELVFEPIVLPEPPTPNQVTLKPQLFAEFSGANYLFELPDGSVRAVFDLKFYTDNSKSQRVIDIHDIGNFAIKVSTLSETSDGSNSDYYGGANEVLQFSDFNAPFFYDIDVGYVMIEMKDYGSDDFGQSMGIKVDGAVQEVASTSLTFGVPQTLSIDETTFAAPTLQASGQVVENGSSGTVSGGLGDVAIDLAFHNVDISRTDFRIGQKVEVDFDVVNYGFEDDVEVKVSWYLSKDQTISSDDWRWNSLRDEYSISNGHYVSYDDWWFRAGWSTNEEYEDLRKGWVGESGHYYLIGEISNRSDEKELTSDRDNNTVIKPVYIDNPKWGAVNENTLIGPVEQYGINNAGIDPDEIGILGTDDFRIELNFTLDQLEGTPAPQFLLALTSGSQNTQINIQLAINGDLNLNLLATNGSSESVKVTKAQLLGTNVFGYAAGEEMEFSLSRIATVGGGSAVILELNGWEIAREDHLRALTFDEVFSTVETGKLSFNNLVLGVTEGSFDPVSMYVGQEARDRFDSEYSGIVASNDSNFEHWSLRDGLLGIHQPNVDHHVVDLESASSIPYLFSGLNFEPASVSAPTTLRLYWSSDQVLDLGDPLAKEISLPAYSYTTKLRPNNWVSVEGLAPGDYSLIADIVGDEVLYEFDEIVVETLTIIAPAELALLPQSASIDHFEVTEGSTGIDYDFVIDNIGDKAAAAATVSLFWSTDEQWDALDTAVSGSLQNVAPIGAGDGLVFSGDAGIISLNIGTHYLIARIEGDDVGDQDTAVIETVTFEVASTPDLLVFTHVDGDGDLPDQSKSWETFTERFWGTPDDDVIDGGTGDDNFVASTGNDYYQGGVGDNQFTIYEPGVAVSDYVWSHDLDNDILRGVHATLGTDYFDDGIGGFWSDTLSSNNTKWISRQTIIDDWADPFIYTGPEAAEGSQPPAEEPVGGGAGGANSGLAFTIVHGDGDYVTGTNANGFNEAFTGTAGNDIVDGGAGNDYLLSSGGVDYFRGGVGTDQYVLTHAGVATSDYVWSLDADDNILRGVHAEGIIYLETDTVESVWNPIASEDNASWHAISTIKGWATSFEYDGPGAVPTDPVDPAEDNSNPLTVFTPNKATASSLNYFDLDYQGDAYSGNEQINGGDLGEQVFASTGDDFIFGGAGWDQITDTTAALADVTVGVDINGHLHTHSAINGHDVHDEVEAWYYNNGGYRSAADMEARADNALFATLVEPDSFVYV